MALRGGTRVAAPSLLWLSAFVTRVVVEAQSHTMHGVYMGALPLHPPPTYYRRETAGRQAVDTTSTVSGLKKNILLLPAARPGAMYIVHG